MAEKKRSAPVIGAMAITRKRSVPEPYRRPDLFDAADVHVRRDEAGRPDWFLGSTDAENSAFVDASADDVRQTGRGDARQGRRR